MNTFINRFFDSFNHFFKVVLSFKGFTRFAAFLLLLAALIIFFLIFTRNSQYILFILLGLFLLFLILIPLTYIEAKRQAENPTRVGSMRIHVHESGDRTRWLENAEVRLALPDAKVLSTDDRGIALFTFSGDTRGKKYVAKATRPGYLPAQKEVKMVDGEDEYIALEADPVRLQQIAKKANEQNVLNALAKRDQVGLSLDELKKMVNLPDEVLNEAVSDLLGLDYVRRGPTKLYVTSKGKNALREP